MWVSLERIWSLGKRLLGMVGAEDKVRGGGVEGGVRVRAVFLFCVVGGSFEG